jgi:choline dehydrogenase
MRNDYLVVGAGSAGATVAARLSENAARSVLLLEAGLDYASTAAIPSDLLDSRDLAGMAHDWGYVASPVAGRTMPYRRGKVTGGTSAINAAAAQRGRPEDFAVWVERGNAGWGWQEVLPLFEGIESDASHGTSGPITISRYADTELLPIQRAFYDACRSAGFADVRDHNSVGASGVGPWPMNRQGTTRISTAIAYLEAARSRKNLAVRAGSLVDKIVFEGSRATGVQLADGSRIEANRIVLAAGAIGSPAILLRSGIGAAHELRELGVVPHLDRPGVGTRLWDHAAVPVYLVPLPGHCVRGRDPRFQVMATFTAEGSSEPGDMQVVLTTHGDISGMPTLLAAAGVPVVAALRVALMLPRGHGRLKLASTDPTVQPKIELDFAADPEDLRRLMHGTRLAWVLANSEPLNRETRGVVGLDADIVSSDERLRRYILDNVGTYCHALGTAPMGCEGDRGAVVDERCQVYGTDNLWLVDASVFPAVPRAVPHLTVIMLAERVAAWLAGPEPTAPPSPLTRGIDADD